MKYLTQHLKRYVLFTSASLALAAPLHSQPADQFIFYVANADLQKAVTVRYSRKLEEVGFTVNHPLVGYRQAMGIDAQGRYALPVAPSLVKNAVWMASDGQIISTTPLQHHPLGARVSREGVAYLPTRLNIGQTGPLYAVAGDGQLLWSNMEAPAIYATPPEHMTVNTNGEIWMGGSASGFSGGWLYTPIIQRIDPSSGKVLRLTELPPTALPNGDTFLSQLVASPDGSMWAYLTPIVVVGSYVQTDGINVLNVIEPDGGYNGNTPQMRIDVDGNPMGPSYWDAEGGFGSEVLRFSKVDGAILDKYSLLSEDFFAAVGSFAIGATGEEMFVAGASEIGMFVARFNLVTGVRSLIHLPSNLSSPQIPAGDPTGFIRANVIDQDGDSDGDGATNREETIAGSHPYDAASRPDGPKVHLSFLPPSNAIRLRFLDPDGLLHPTLGLDLSTVSLVADGYGEVFPALLNFVTSVSLSPDGTDATIEFGGMPMAKHLKIGLEARVSDRTGAYGWDWQITPPGIR